LVGVGGGRRFTIGSVVLLVTAVVGTGGGGGSLCVCWGMYCCGCEAIAEEVDEADEEVDDEDRDAGA